MSVELQEDRPNDLHKLNSDEISPVMEPVLCHTRTDDNTVENIPANNTDPIDKPSKRKLKRLRKLLERSKMQAQWKLERKLKRKKRKEQYKLSSSDVPLEKPKITQMSSSARKFTVVIDFSYDDLMSPKDLIKCGNQVIRCYSANRRSSNPVQLHFCHFTGKIEEEMAKNNGYKKWDIHLHEENYLDVFDKSDLVYLTSESRNVLETLEENKVYIIGGLVDHNAHKGVSYRKAVYEGISHAQLPIKKYIHMKARSVLTINHVFEILLKVSNGETWRDTLLSVVPQRFCDSNTSTTKKAAKYCADELFDEEDKDDEPSNEAETSLSLSEPHVDDESEIVAKSSADSQIESNSSTTAQIHDTSPAAE